MPKKEFDLDSILLEVGQFGWYQIRTYCFILLPILVSAVHVTQFVFTAAYLAARCQVPECESNPPKFETKEWGVWALPDGGGRCERFLPVGTTCAAESFHATETKKCSSWVYENNDSIVSTFDLACDDWKRTLVGTIYSAGLFVALPLTALISDNFGRRIAFITTAVAPALVGVARSFVQSYAAYVSLEFLDAAVGAGVYSSGFILGKLLSKGKKKEAARIIFKVAAVNKKKLSAETIRELSDVSTNQDDSKSLTDVPNDQPSLTMQVLKSRVIISRLCICSFWWITVTFIYYGLSINSVSLAGNRYVNYILTALVEIPGYCMSVLTLDRFGRKSSIMTAFFICGISLVCLPFIPVSSMTIILTMMGKLTISMVFASIYIYTIELFPTEARHSMMGICSMVGRLGSTTAPMTPLLMAYMEALPYLVFGLMSATAGLLMLLTPETLHIRLPDTIQQAENIATAPRTKHPTDVIVD